MDNLTIIEEIFRLLNKHSKPNFPITKTSIARLGTDKIKDIYRFLTNYEQVIDDDKDPRPACPVEQHYSRGREKLILYKKAMCNYIAHKGLELSPTETTTPLLEAIANYAK